MKRLRHIIGSYLYKTRAASAKRKLLAKHFEPGEITRAEWQDSIKDPTLFYERCFHYFYKKLPEELREHRKYFSENRRGFGEDTFHTMWWLIYNDLKPTNFLEIGVYRGQVISLIGLLSKMLSNPCDINAISPFSPAGDAGSTYLTTVDYHADVLINFKHFQLPEPKTHRAYSTDEAARQVIKSREWDCIFIDGNHDYEIVKEDWENCSKNIRLGGLIILDDSGTTSSYKPPAFATSGFPGPSQIASEIDRKHFTEVLQVGHNRAFLRIA